MKTLKKKAISLEKKGKEQSTNYKTFKVQDKISQ